MAKSDYYATLGVDRRADDAALKSAYRKLAMKFHPDKNPDDAAAEQKFKEVNEAYDALKNPAAFNSAVISEPSGVTAKSCCVQGTMLASVPPVESES